MTTTSETIEIRGFHCSGCADNLSEALNRLDGVIVARADFDRRNLSIRFDADRVSESDIDARIRAAGFEPVRA